MHFDAEKTLLKAIARHQEGLFGEAESLYRSILTVNPDHPDANHNLGVLAAGINRPEAGLPFLKKALRINPNVPQFWLSYIDALIKLRRPKAARAALHRGKSILTDEQRRAIEIRLQVTQAGKRATFSKVEALLPDPDKFRSPRFEDRDKRNTFCQETEERSEATSASPSPEDVNSLLVLFNNRNFEEARKAAEIFTMKYPNESFGWKALGNILAELADDASAIDAFNKAALISPDDREIFYNLGISLYTLELYAEAETNFRKAIAIDPGYAEAYNNLGNTLKARGLLYKAEHAYKAAIQLNPLLIEARNNLGLVLTNLAKFHEAEAILGQLIHSGLGDAITYNNLGLTLRAQYRMAEAEAAFEESLILSRNFSDARINLACCKISAGKIMEFEDLVSPIIRDHHDCPKTLNNLGVLMADAGLLSEAETLFKAALNIRHNYFNAYNNLAYVNLSAGDLVSAETNYRKAISVDSKNKIALSNLIFMQNYKPEIKGEELRKQAVEFGRAIHKNEKREFLQCKTKPRSDSLRIGFVSGDFYNHPVGYFVTGFLNFLDPAKIRIFGFYDNEKHDQTTDTIKSNTAGWENIYCMSDEDLVNIIRSKNIDILVDLSGHTDRNRLSVFSCKPAPVQISWLGYCGTTGLPQIDYVLGDPYVTPVTEEHHFVENIWRLPETYWCFTAPENDLSVAGLPAQKNRHITFGCFNNVAKMNDEVIYVWSAIIKECQGSKLLLKARQFSDKKIEFSFRDRFCSNGVEENRLIIEPASSRYDYLKTYDKVDIALDPFPFPGGTTSIEGLWMGVPFITKKGDRFYSHNGETILYNIGLPEWIADNEDDYVRKAIIFSKQIDTLANLRQRLRPQILASPLFDAARFARNFEKAMFEIWENIARSKHPGILRPESFN